MIKQIRQTIQAKEEIDPLMTVRNPFAPDLISGVIAKKRNAWLILAAFFLQFIVGCGVKNLGIDEAQMLPESRKEKWLLDAPFERVWQVAAEEAEMNADRILAFSKEDGLISWSEEVEDWSDPGQGYVTKIQTGNPDGKIPGRGTAVTTIWVESLGSKSMLHIERTHYGREPLPSAGNSSVDYEKRIYHRILEALR